MHTEPFIPADWKRQANGKINSMAVCLWQERWEPRIGHLMRQEGDGGCGRLPRKGYDFIELYPGKLFETYQSTRHSFIIMGGKTNQRAHSGNLSIS